MVKVNGEMFDAAGKSVKELIENKGYSLSRIAVELNGEILLKSEYDTTVLADGDSVEVVSFVGGG